MIRILLFLIPYYCFSQDPMLFQKNIDTLNSKERFEIIKIDLNNLSGANLGNYLSYLKSNKIRLNKFNSVFIQKANSSNSPFDLYHLIKELLNINKRANKSIIQDLLIEKQEIWDINNWSEKFWNLIIENKFEIKSGSYYTLDSEGKKIYDIEDFFKSKLESNELGNNPLLFVNDNLVEYDSGKLLELLKNIEVGNVEILDKQSSVKLFGKRGIDGQIKVFTNN